MQGELTFQDPEVLTFGQFTARRGYDVEISHDRLRFPHGISKRQARDNRRAALHHLGEAFRAANDYQKAIDAGEVRPPTDSETQRARLGGHPDRADTQATWRVSVKRLLRNDPAMTEFAAITQIIASAFGGSDPWAETLGGVGTIEQQSAARLEWITASRVAA